MSSLDPAQDEDYWTTIALLTNQHANLPSESKVSSQKAQIFDCQLKYSIKCPNLTTEWGGRVNGGGVVSMENRGSDY